MADREIWPKDYVKTYAWRQKQIGLIRSNPIHLAGAKEYYKTRPVEFIDHWCDTYDPRVAGGGRPARMPFRLFQRQRELVEFVVACLDEEAHGLVEKCRDMGATWTLVSLSNWLWLFRSGAAVGWGSRKEQLVDRIGDPDSIFEKMRMQLLSLPREFLPKGFSPKDHLSYMKIINPETGATITGEAGDNIGRGGRKLIYIKDESAWYERPERIEAALADNTRVQIDISSVNGPGNVFHRRREAGTEYISGRPLSRTTANVFVMDWRDHPEKSEAWYKEREQAAINSGLQHIFEQEINRNYFATVLGTIIDSKWVKAAIDAHIELGWPDEGPWGGALDVADGGNDRNAIALRRGPVLRLAEEWGDRDTAVTARRAIEFCEGRGPLSLQYDCIGVGSGVKAETNRLADEGLLPTGLRLVPWDAGAPTQDADDNVIPGDENTPLNRDFFANLKAQGWWALRRRFENTYRAVVDGRKYDPDEMISLPSTLPRIRQIEKELCQPTASKGSRLRLVVDKTPEGTRSPNIADAIMMAYWPIIEHAGPTIAFGTWGRAEEH